MGCLNLRNIIDEVLARDVNAINLQNLPARAGFEVGLSVHVSARMGPTFNKPGSDSAFEKNSGSSSEVLCSVRYLINRGGESDLPAALLSSPAETPTRRLSSSSSSSSAASSDSRRVA